MLHDPFNENMVDQVDEMILSEYLDDRTPERLDDLVEDGWADIHSVENAEVPVEEVVDDKVEDYSELVDDPGVESVEDDEFVECVDEVPEDLVVEAPIGSGIESVVERVDDGLFEVLPDKSYLSDGAPDSYVERPERVYDDNYEQLLEGLKKVASV